MRLLIFAALLVAVNSSGATDGGATIWTKNMGDSGACAACRPAIPMSAADASRWERGLDSISLKRGSPLSQASSCMSWSTQGTCEFRQRDLLSLEATLDASEECDGLWVAPLWLAPDHWSPPQHATGELDVFEQGCVPGAGYVVSFGESKRYVLRDVWEGEQSLSISILFDRDKDEVRFSRRLGNGTSVLRATYRNYYRDTHEQTRGGAGYLHFVSDVWNACASLPCGRGRHRQQLSSSLRGRADDDSKCSFSVSGIRVRLAPGSRFRSNHDFCSRALQDVTK